MRGSSVRQSGSTHPARRTQVRTMPAAERRPQFGLRSLRKGRRGRRPARPPHSLGRAEHCRMAASRLGLAQAAADAVSYDGTSGLLGDREADARRALIGRTDAGFAASRSRRSPCDRRAARGSAVACAVSASMKRAGRSGDAIRPCRLRPKGACGRARGGRPGPCGHPWWQGGRGSRDGACGRAWTVDSAFHGNFSAVAAVCRFEVWSEIDRPLTRKTRPGGDRPGRDRALEGGAEFARLMREDAVEVDAGEHVDGSTDRRRSGRHRGPRQDRPGRARGLGERLGEERPSAGRHGRDRGLCRCRRGSAGPCGTRRVDLAGEARLRQPR